MPETASGNATIPAVKARSGGLCQAPVIEWQGDTPRQQDIYYHPGQGLAESEYVYLQGNDLPRRFAACCGNFTVAEVGFGTGLNFLACVRLWKSKATAGARLRYIAFEPFPLSSAHIARALGVFGELASLAARMLAIWPPLVVGSYSLWFARDVELLLHFVPIQQGCMSFQADAWFYDAFAPARDPQAWNSAAMANIASASHRGTTLATFSVAGVVCKGLQGNGFVVHKVAGFGGKRHMLKATFCAYNEQAAQTAQQATRIAVVGGGMAGCALLASLAGMTRDRQAELVLFERREALAERASRHHHAVLYAKTPWLASWRQRWLWHCWCASYSWFDLFPQFFSCVPKTLCMAGAKGQRWMAGWEDTFTDRAHGDWLQFSAEGNKVTLPRAGLLHMQNAARTLVEEAVTTGASVYSGGGVRSVEAHQEGTLVTYRHKGLLKRELFTHVVLCTNSATPAMLSLPDLHLYKGQVNRLILAHDLDRVYGSDVGYIAPVGHKLAECGGTFIKRFATLRPQPGQGESLWQALSKRMGWVEAPVTQTACWADIRSVGRDHLPLVGPYRQQTTAGVYLNTGYGGKGALAILPTSRMLAATLLGNDAAVGLPPQLSPGRF